MGKETMITAEYLSGALNEEADFQSKNCEGFKQVEVKTAYTSIHLPRMGKARHIPFCITSASLGSSLHVMKTKSF